MYYRIFHDIDEKKIGKFPQVRDGIVPTSVDDKGFVGNYSFEPVDQNIIIPKGILSKRAKKTDLISSSFIGFSSRLFVSKRLYDILSSSKSAGIQYLKSALISKVVEEEYWIINPFLSNMEFINYSNSHFGFMDPMGNQVIAELGFPSAKEFTDAYKKNRIDAITNPYPNHRPLVISKLAFVDHNNIDFFSVAPLMYGGIGYFCSQKLKNKIEHANCTGIIFTEPNQRYP